MSRSERFFRQLLRLFPSDFRGDFGDDMTQTFREHREDTLAQGGPMAELRFWRDTIQGILTTAPREHVDVLRQDVRYALRNLRRNSGFTAVAVLALAVGIGANSAVFSIVNGVLFKRLPYPNPEQLVTLFEKVPGVPVDKFGFSPPDFETLRRASTSFSGLGAYRNDRFELSGIGQSDRLTVTKVSPAIFSILGVPPLMGRGLTEDDDATNASVAVVSYGTWAGAFGRDPNVLGRTIGLDRRPYTIVGVMPESFTFPPRGADLNGEPAALFVPISFTPFERRAFGSMYNNTVLGRLKPDVTMVRARAELDTISRPLAEAYPAQLRDMAERIIIPFSPLSEETVGKSRRLLLMLTGAVALVLLIGCVDVANLMLTRAGSRHRELAIRAAVGASPARVVRQLLTESFVLAAFGAAAGLALAYWTLQVFLSLAGTALPRAESIRFDWTVVAFTALVGLATPLLFGIVPAMRSARVSTQDALKEGSHATAGPGRHRLLGSLVVTQFALALMLSVGAGLFVRSFVRLLATDPGFRSDHALNTMTTLPTGRYSTGQMVRAFHERIVEEARRIPGVVFAGASTERPLAIRERRAFTPDESARPMPSLTRTVAATWTVGQYFEALGIPLKRGRFFIDADGTSGQPVAIVNQTLADRAWPGADPVGRRLKWGGNANSPAPWMTIVGVVGDVKQGKLQEETLPLVYVPLVQEVPDAMRGIVLRFYTDVNLVTRTASAPEATMTAMRALIQRADPALPPAKTEDIAEIVSESVRPQRFSMSVVSAFAFVALALAAIGIYGVLANVVHQQTPEIGLRVALGASRAALMRMVVGRALTMAAIGAAIGMAGAFALGRLIAGLLYEIKPTDAVTFLGSAVLLALLAVAASLVPAWRAMRIDPLAALRGD